MSVATLRNVNCAHVHVGGLMRNAADPPQCTCFAESSTKRSQRLAALRKLRSQCTVEAKRVRREQEKVQKKKACCGESSQAKYKLGSLFMLGSIIVVLELCLTSQLRVTYPHAQCLLARRGARHHAHAYS